MMPSTSFSRGKKTGQLENCRGFEKANSSLESIKNHDPKITWIYSSSTFSSWFHITNLECSLFWR